MTEIIYHEWSLFVLLEATNEKISSEITDNEEIVKLQKAYLGKSTAGIGRELGTRINL